MFGVLTNTVPVDAYRGAGRPEACYLLERMMDLAAAELGLTRPRSAATISSPPNSFPHTVVTGMMLR